jgi:hypothetical protein
MDIRINGRIHYTGAPTKPRKQNVDLQNVDKTKRRQDKTSTCQNVDYNKTSTTIKRRKVYLAEHD